MGRSLFLIFWGNPRVRTIGVKALGVYYGRSNYIEAAI